MTTKPHCNFCGLSHDDMTLVAGKDGTHICADCVAVCRREIEKHDRGFDANSALNDLRAEFPCDVLGHVPEILHAELTTEAGEENPTWVTLCRRCGERFDTGQPLSEWLEKFLMAKPK